MAEIQTLMQVDSDDQKAMLQNILTLLPGTDSAGRVILFEDTSMQQPNLKRDSMVRYWPFGSNVAKFSHLSYDSGGPSEHPVHAI